MCKVFTITDLSVVCLYIQAVNVCGNEVYDTASKTLTERLRRLKAKLLDYRRSSDFYSLVSRLEVRSKPFMTSYWVTIHKNEENHPTNAVEDVKNQIFRGLATALLG